MQEKCPKCGEPLITKTIKKELGLGSIDYPIAQICPKCHWSKDLTGAGDIVSKPVIEAPGVIKEEKKEEKPPVVTPAPPKPEPPKAKPKLQPSQGFNKTITIALAILVLAGLAWAFYPHPPEKINNIPTTATPTVTQTAVTTATPVPEVTPTGNKTRVRLDSRRGFIPDKQSIKPGDELIWENSETETVTLISSGGLYISNDGKYDNQTLAYGKRTSYIFKKPGTYMFYLKGNQNLNGTITVES